MLEEIDAAIEEYHQKWHKLIGERQNKHFFEALKPTAVGWKVKDRAAYQKACAELHDHTDMIVEKWMNGRWIAKLHLRGDKLNCGIEIINIMERRPGSKDPVGLDHLDFYSDAMKEADSLLKVEPKLKWTWEANDAHDNYRWLSIWFDGTEAKLKAGTVLDIIQVELDEINQHLKA